jgi:hypothetical protein
MKQGPIRALGVIGDNKLSPLATHQLIDKAYTHDTKIMNNKAHNNYDLIEAPEFKHHLLSGRAGWDARGNSVWEWQTAPGVYSREISSQQLQALQATELRVIDSTPGHISVYTAWRRTYADVFARPPNQSNELVMPARPKVNGVKARAFDRFLKRLGLPS